MHDVPGPKSPLEALPRGADVGLGGLELEPETLRFHAVNTFPRVSQDELIQEMFIMSVPSWSLPLQVPLVSKFSNIMNKDLDI